MRVQKRGLDLLKAYLRLRDSGTECQLLMVGDGEQRADLEAYVRKHKVPDVSFLGFRNQSELPAWYSVSDVFVLPSEKEAWGLSVNEALCVGTPTVTSNEIGCAVDLIEDGETGAVFPLGDIDALADAIKTVLNAPASMRDGVMRKMDAWSNEQTVEGIKTALRSVIHRE